jgi:predicted metal-dependent peptidase
MATAAELMVKARANLLMESPFFGALALRLKFVEDTKCDTGWTDGVHLGYNPEWVGGMTIGKIKGFIAHEVYHNALGHPFRKQHRDHSAWNAACDLVLNGRLRAAGFELPDDGLFDDSKKDMAPEEVYDQFPKGKGKHPGKPGSDPGGCGECRDGADPDEGRSKEENKQLEHEWKNAVADAAAAARMAGKLPADIERMIDKLFEPQIDWREVLAMKIDPNAKDDYSWSRRNRRFQDIYLPSIRSEQVGEVVILMDTSGSMWGGDDLAFAKTELKAIFDMVHPRMIHVIHVDAAVHKHDRHTPDDFDLDFKPQGGGGTSFIPGFEYIVKQGIQPEIVIYFTDMYGDFPKWDYGFDVMWVDTHGQWSGTVPFGQYFKLKVEK